MINTSMSNPINTLHTLSDLKQFIHRTLAHNPLVERNISVLDEKKERLVNLIKLFDSNPELLKHFKDDLLKELSINLSHIEKLIKEHPLNDNLENSFSSLSIKQLNQEIKEATKQMNAFIRKNKRSKIGRLRLRAAFNHAYHTL
jgi:hypothetical protein